MDAAFAVSIAAAIFMAAWGGIALTRETGRVATIWFANAILLAALLRLPLRAWPGLMAAGLSGNLAANLMSGDPLSSAAALVACNGVEVALCAALLRQVLGPETPLDVTRPRPLLAFLGIAGFVAPSVSALLAAGLLHWLAGAPFISVLRAWYAADALGLLTVTPVLLMLRWSDVLDLFRPTHLASTLATLLVLAGVLAVSLGQKTYPLTFLIFPGLVLVAFRLGPAGTALGLAMTAAAGLTAAMQQTGPLSLMGGTLRDRLLVLQVFLAGAACMSLLVTAALAERRRLSVALDEARSRAEEAARGLAASQTRHQTLVDALPQKVWITTPQGEATYFNEQFHAYHGPIGPGLAARTGRQHPGDAERISSLREEGFATGRGFEVEVRLRRKDGVYRWHHVAMVPLRGADGDIVEWLGTSLDIDELRQTQLQLQKAKEAAEAVGSAKAEFLATMSHELRTPLTAILGVTEIMLDRHHALAPEQQQRYLDLQKEAGEALLEIINDVLDFSKIEAGQLILETAPFSPGELASSCVAMLAPRAQAKGLLLTADVAPDVPDRVLGDPARLKQVLLNLLSNAVKFTPDGSVRLTISRADTGPISSLRFEVVDTGIGIEAEAIDRIFDRFTQAGPSTTRQFGGTGLGLAIAKRVLGLMGGTLEVRSRIGEGSTFGFIVALPEAGGLSVGPARGDAAVPRAGRRVQLADDNAMNRAVISERLTSAGHEVAAVADGQKAIDAVQGDPTGFDVLLMDVQMPVLGGHEASRVLRRLGYRLPIIALTANASIDETERCLAAGMDMHLAKPIKWPQLLSAIEYLAARDGNATAA